MTTEKLEKEERDDADRGQRPAEVEEQAAADIQPAVEEIKEGQKTEVKEEVKQEAQPEEKLAETAPEKPKDDWRRKGAAPAWIPKTELGRDIVAGKYTDIFAVLDTGKIILEAGIVDYLIPNLKQEIIYIGGTPGKGGGIKRTATRITTRMHKSGRRYNSSSLVVVGNEDGVIGIGKESSKEHRQAIEKAVNQAKLAIIKVKRGCGSWECNCQTGHSLPFKVVSKHGSVRVTLNPAPKGIGIVADEESKKILKLAGIKDVWASCEGQTSTRINLAFAVFEALKKLSTVKGDL